MIGNGIKMLVERAFDSCGHPLVNEELDAGYAAMIDIYSGHLTTFTRPMPGARAAIRLLHAEGFRIGVVTKRLSERYGCSAENSRRSLPGLSG